MNEFTYFFLSNVLQKKFAVYIDNFLYFSVDFNLQLVIINFYS